MTTTNNFAPHPLTQQPAAAASYGLPDPWELEAWALPYFPELGGAGGTSAYAPRVAAAQGGRQNLGGYREPETAAHDERGIVTGYREPSQAARGERPDVQGYREPSQAAQGGYPNIQNYQPPAPAYVTGSPVTAEEAEYLSLLTGFGTPPRGVDSDSRDDEGYSPVVVPSSAGAGGPNGFDVNRIRADFPILNEKVSGGKRLVWLDNGATTQKPRQVIDRISYFYEHENSNIHRGAHELAARSTDAYENARQTAADFLGAPSKDNIVFVRGTTEGINLVAQAYVKPLLSAGDEIILTILEHHANIVPWQIIAQETGAVIKVAPVDDSGQIILPEYGRLFSRKTKFVSVTHVSNALGTVTPVHEMVRMAHCCGVRILIDGAQSVAHAPVNMAELDADFFVLSGHKIFAPTGIGALYGKTDALEEAKPYQGGGNMIKDVTFERTVYNPPPNKFEAGTGNIADAIGLGAALDYVTKVGIANISAYEHDLLNYATGGLSRIKGLRLIGTATEKASVLSFVMEQASVEQIGKHLSSRGIAVRAGHHCAQPILRRFGLEATVRPTLAFYNTAEEVDLLVSAVKELE